MTKKEFKFLKLIQSNPLFNMVVKTTSAKYNNTLGKEELAKVKAMVDEVDNKATAALAQVPDGTSLRQQSSKKPSK